MSYNDNSKPIWKSSADVFSSEACKVVRGESVGSSGSSSTVFSSSFGPHYSGSVSPSVIARESQTKPGASGTINGVPSSAAQHCCGRACKHCRIYWNRPDW